MACHGCLKMQQSTDDIGDGDGARLEPKQQAVCKNLTLKPWFHDLSEAVRALEARHPNNIGV